MEQKHVAKPLKYKELEGISKSQLDQHHDTLYVGYVNKLNEIEEKLRSADRGAANATWSDFGELKREEPFAANAIKLHEGYFENLGGKGVPEGKILELIKQDFGSYENFEGEFKATVLAARGWVVLAYNWDDRKLRIYLSDIHSQGVWNASPLLVLDVYEHAYMIDYGVARKKYIDAFMKNVDWAFVNSLVERHQIDKSRQR